MVYPTIDGQTARINRTFMNQKNNFSAYIKQHFIDLQHELRTQLVSKYFRRDMVTVGLGIIVYMIGFSFLIFPQRITTGGLSGLCNLIMLSTGIDIAIPYNIINVGLLVLAFFLLDKNFFIKTLISITILAFAISEMTSIAVPDQSLESNFRLMILADQPVVALILGSLLIGLGLGLVFSANGSTGGTDVIVAIISKYKRMTFGRIFMIVDGTIVVASYFVNVYLAVNPMDPMMALEKVVYSIIQVILVSITLDWYIRSNRRSVQMMIFSSKYEEINEVITKKLNRGSTIIEATGGYTGQPSKVIVVVARRRQSMMITRLIEGIDPQAFVTIGEVQGVYGRGFDSISQK